MLFPDSQSTWALVDWSPLSQHGLMGLLFAIGGVPYFRRPPPGLGVAAMACTRDLTATATSSGVNNRGGEQGLDVSNFPLDLGEALPEV